MDLQSARVLVTGGAGFIGSNLVERLLGLGAEVTVLDCFDDAYDPKLKRKNLEGTRATVVEGDIRDQRVVGELVARADAVVHMAARAGVRESLEFPLLYEEVNVRGTAIILEALRGRPGVPLVFASSSSVYGAGSVAPFHEEQAADRPVSPYAATKRAGELIIHAAHAATGLDATCLRFFTVYGPRQRPSMAIARFVRLALAGEPLPIYGDGSALRDFTWVGDAVTGIIAALELRAGFEVINLGCGSPIRLLDLVDAISVAVGRPVRIEHLPDQPGDVPMTHADISKARRLLGWAPTLSIARGLEQYLAQATRP